MSLACIQVGVDYTGRAIYDCMGVAVKIREPEQEYHPADRGISESPLQELINDWDEQNKFNERMRDYEQTKPLHLQRLNQ